MNPLFRLATLAVVFLSLVSHGYAQGAGVEPDALKSLTKLLDRYSNVSSYSGTVDVSVFTPTGAQNTTASHRYKADVSWDSKRGLRVEARDDKAQFIIRNDGHSIHLHWLKHAGADANLPFDANADNPTNLLVGTPLDLPGISLVCGQVTLEKLQKLTINRLTFSPNGLLYNPQGQSVRTHSLELNYTNDRQQQVNLIMVVGDADNTLYNMAHQIQDATGSHGSLEIYSPAEGPTNFSDDDWLLDFPLMGDSLKAAAPPALTQEQLLKQLPPIKATDVNGKPFVVSPEDKKVVLFYFFIPGSARYYIDDVQQLHEEGELRGFRVVGVVTRGGKPENRTTAAVRAFIGEHHVSFPVYVEDNKAGLNELERQVGNYGGAQTIIYDAEGQLRSDATFFHTPELRAVVNHIAPLIKP